MLTFVLAMCVGVAVPQDEALLRHLERIAFESVVTEECGPAAPMPNPSVDNCRVAMFRQRHKEMQVRRVTDAWDRRLAQYERCILQPQWQASCESLRPSDVPALGLFASCYDRRMWEPLHWCSRNAPARRPWDDHQRQLTESLGGRWPGQPDPPAEEVQPSPEPNANFDVPI